MTIQLDPVTYKKLVIAKQIHQHAVNQAEARHSATNRILAVIGFDLAVETIVGAIFAALNQQTLPPNKFPKILEECDVLLKPYDVTLSMKSFALQAHDIRNAAQHRARVPTDVEVNDCRTHTKDFCSTLVKDLWGTAFDELSLVELIDDNKLKQLLNTAMTHIASQDYRKAITLANGAFHWASETIWDFLPTRRQGAIQDLYTDPNDLKEMLIAMSKNQDEVGLYYAILISSGVSLANYRRYNERTIKAHFIRESIPSPQGGSSDLYKIRAQVHGANKNPSEDDALWVYGFAIDSILNWQNQGLNPKVPTDEIEYADILINWGDEVIFIGNS